MLVKLPKCIAAAAALATRLLHYASSVLAACGTFCDSYLHQNRTQQQLNVIRKRNLELLR
jgi:hypothetical protein